MNARLYSYTTATGGWKQTMPLGDCAVRMKRSSSSSSVARVRVTQLQKSVQVRPLAASVPNKALHLWLLPCQTFNKQQHSRLSARSHHTMDEHKGFVNNTVRFKPVCLAHTHTHAHLKGTQKQQRVPGAAGKSPAAPLCLLGCCLWAPPPP